MLLSIYDSNFMQIGSKLYAVDMVQKVPFKFFHSCSLSSSTKNRNSISR